MQNWSTAREVEKPKPVYPKDASLWHCLDEIDAWLSNDQSIQRLDIHRIVEWREALAKHLGVAEDSWFERMQVKP